MRFLKKFWKSLVQALKEFWEWLKKLFGRKKKAKGEPPKPKPEEIPPKPDPPTEPEPEPEPVEPVKPVGPESPKKRLPEEPVADDLNLLAVNEQSDTTGFIRVHEVGGFRVIQEHFQSLEHLVDCLSRRQKNTVMASAGCNASNKKDSEFSRANSYYAAVHLMRSGYTDILPDIENGTSESIKKLQGSYQRKKSVLAPNFSGASPSVPRHLMGLPDAMLNRDSIPRKVKTIHIVYATHAPWFVSGDTFIKAGTALLSAIQLIENSGVSVKLDCIFYAGKSDTMSKGEVAFGVVPLKDYSNRLNLQKLCFPIAHPAMLRRIGFRFLETVPELRSSEFTRGYGTVLSNYELTRMFKTNSKIVVLDVGTIHRFNYNVESIIRYIQDAAKR